MEILEARLRRLERRVRVQTVFLAIVGSLGVLFFAFRALDISLLTPRVVVSERFVLRGPDGTTSGVWGTTEEYGTGIFLLDSENKSRATLALTPKQEPTLTLVDERGKVAYMGFGLYGNAEPRRVDGIVLYDSKQQARVTLLLNDRHEPSLSIMDKEGRYRAVLGVSELHWPSGVTIRRPESFLVLFDEEKLVWQAPE